MFPDFLRFGVILGSPKEWFPLPEPQSARRFVSAAAARFGVPAQAPAARMPLLPPAGRSFRSPQESDMGGWKQALRSHLSRQKNMLPAAFPASSLRRYVFSQIRTRWRETTPKRKRRGQARMLLTKRRMFARFPPLLQKRLGGHEAVLPRRDTRVRLNGSAYSPAS